MPALPRIHDVGIFLFIAGAIGLANGHKAMALIKAASSRVPLKCPEAQSIKSVLCYRQESSPDATALPRRQYVKLVDPSFAKRNNTDQFGIVEITPNLAFREQSLPEKPTILIRCMQPRKGWQRLIERLPKHGRGLICFFYCQLPEHSASCRRILLDSITRPNRNVSCGSNA